MNDREPRIESWVEQRAVAFLQLRDEGSTMGAGAFVAASRIAAAGVLAEDAGEALRRLGRRLAGLERAERALSASGARFGAAAPPPDFEIEHRLGRGGYGQVFRARQRSLGRQVALKVPLIAAALSTRDRQRLEREAAAIARLNHPGIVTLYDLQEHGGTPFLVMELVHGTSLDVVLAELAQAREPGLGARLGQPELDPIQAACEIVSQVLAALAYAHEHGVVHRDLKPSNVMIDGEGRARILDFGLAHTDGAASMTRSGELVGTPQYLAPEALDDADHGVGPAADVYAAGVLLYQLLTLRYPFGSGAIESTLARIRCGDAIPTRAGHPEIPVDLAAIVDKAMARLPRHRYSGCAAFAADLDRFRRGLPITARPVGRLGRVLRRARRRPDLAAAIAGILLVSGAFAAITVDAAQTRQHEYERRIGEGHERVRALLGARQWSRAVEVMDEIDAALDAERTDARLRAEHARLRHDADLVLELEKLRDPGDLSDLATVDARYAALFAPLGIDLGAAGDAAAAKALSGHPLAARLVAGLDEWMRVLVRVDGADSTRVRRVQMLASAADTDPVRVRVRTASLEKDIDVLQEVATSDSALDLSPPVLEALGMALERAEKRDAAARAYRLGPILHPDDFWMHRNLAAFLMRASEPEDRRVALQCLSSALALRPRDTTVLRDLASVFAEVGEGELAVRTAQRALELDPDDPELLLCLSVGQLRSGRPEQSIETLEKMIELTSETRLQAEGHGRIGATCQHIGRSQEAREHLERALELDPTMTRHAVSLAFVCLQRNEQKRAEQLLRRAIELAPDQMNARLLLCIALEKRGDALGALEIHEQIVASAPAMLDDVHPQLLSAAVCALQVAEGSGADAAEPDAEQRAGYRRKAVRWLERCLTVAARKMIADAASEEHIRRWLGGWRTTPGLAGIRDRERVAELPADEQEAVRRLWARYDGVLR